jgi:hypothetical protein
MEAVARDEPTAENIARMADVPPETVVGTALQGWLGSPEHRANLLSRRFDRVGIGVAGCPGDAVVITADFAGPTAAERHAGPGPGAARRPRRRWTWARPGRVAERRREGRTAPRAPSTVRPRPGAGDPRTGGTGLDAGSALGPPHGQSRAPAGGRP